MTGESDVTQVRVGSCIADSDALTLLVPLVHGAIVGDRLPHWITALTSCSEGAEGGMSTVDGVLGAHRDKSVVCLCVGSEQ